MSSYVSGLRRYLTFCTSFALNPFPLSEPILCRFVASLYISGLQPGSVRQYLSAIRFSQIAVGGTDPAYSTLSQLHYVLRGMRRLRPTCARQRRLPITIGILRLLFSHWSSPVTYEGIMLWAACTLAFFGFLRSGEFIPTRHYPCPLAVDDFQVDSITHPTLLAVTLRHSKTDPFGAGVTIYLGRAYDDICPVVAVLAYIAVRPPFQGPLFIHRDGSPLTRFDLVTSIRHALSGSGLPLDSFTGHSFRIGAATSAALAGLPDSLIQTLGRWRSSAFRAYIRTPVSTLAAVPHNLVSQMSERVPMPANTLHHTPSLLLPSSH